MSVLWFAIFSRNCSLKYQFRDLNAVQHSADIIIKLISIYLFHVNLFSSPRVIDWLSGSNSATSKTYNEPGRANGQHFIRLFEIMSEPRRAGICLHTQIVDMVLTPDSLNLSYEKEFIHFSPSCEYERFFCVSVEFQSISKVV